jgi:hypothetical protein
MKASTRGLTAAAVTSQAQQSNLFLSFLFSNTLLFWPLFLLPMEFTFGHHGDIILTHGKESIDLGYTSNGRIPFLFWLHRRQLVQPIPLPELPFTGSAEAYESKEALLDAVVYAAVNMPTSSERFGRLLTDIRIRSGSNRWCYDFSLDGDALEFKEGGDRHLLLTPAESDEALQTYMRFVEHPDCFEPVREEVAFALHYVRARI